ncbi:GlxA family transcriptional regulator [Curvibacter sp. CHRR-16]|uniref:GlxA family transcriptional regulator n=1 Tax=Curvibacter sp. CHRR-16 TaxID=2835872 RepID=UPI0020239AF9|nr:GlxA family transcriptional regulator [Curvibacter sp. CHRR-16]
MLLNDYSMIAFANALEAFRMANYISRRELYRWEVVPITEQGVVASNGLQMHTTGDLRTLDDCSMVMVCAGVDVRRATTDKVHQVLRHLAGRDIALGALCTGSYALASAGLLDNYRCSVHWENLAAMREEFPRIRFTQAVYVIDHDRFTSSGGTAPLDMVLRLIRDQHGRQLATQISEQFILERQRAEDDCQKAPQPECIGPGYEHLAEALQFMAANIEEPLSVLEIANAIPLSVRQLERLFHRYCQMSPAQYYMQLRLQRARELLTHSALPIMEITVACGFQSASHFCKAYRQLFGHAPSEERRQSKNRPDIAVPGTVSARTLQQAERRIAA